MKPTETQLRAASEMEAALCRLDLEPGETTDAETAAQDAILAPATVDRPEIDWADGRQNFPKGGDL